METIYEVWDAKTSNQIGAYRTEDEARLLLVDVLGVNGPDVARDVVVLAYFPDGATPREPVLILDGADFVAEKTERIG